MVAFTLYVSFPTTNCVEGSTMRADTTKDIPRRREILPIASSIFFIVQPFFLNCSQTLHLPVTPSLTIDPIYINLNPIYLIPVFKASPYRSIRKKSQSHHDITDTKLNGTKNTFSHPRSKSVLHCNFRNYSPSLPTNSRSSSVFR